MWSKLPCPKTPLEGLPLANQPEEAENSYQPYAIFSVNSLTCAQVKGF
jgi:hypothetical protein